MANSRRETPIEVVEDPPPEAAQARESTWKDRHRKDLDVWMRLGTDLTDLGQRAAVRELKHHNKKAAVPLVRVMVDTVKSIARELTKDDGDDDET